MNGHLRAYMGFDQGYVDYHDQPGYMSFIQESWLDWRARLGRIDPFFAYFHFLDLHGPNAPKPGYAGIYGRYDDDWASMPGKKYKARRDAIRGRQLVPDANAVEQLRADYDAVLTQVDAKLGAFLETLEADGLYDDSLIVLTGDHGDAFMEHGVIAHSWVPHEELIRVPLIVKLPHSRNAGRRVDRQVRLVDVAPTLIEFAGGRAPPGLDGVSLLPLLLDTEGGGPPAYAISEHGDTLAVRTEDRKYIQLRNGFAEYYDLRADPGEQNNLAESHAAEMLPFAEIARRAEADRKGRKVGEVEVDPATVEALRAIGYMD
jgi:arylsulfatase A-like enzyme